MTRAGVMERDGRLCAQIWSTLPEVVRDRTELLPVSRRDTGHWDVLTVAPDPGQLPEGLPSCRVLLVPGQLCWLAGRIPSVWAVSYGFSSRDTLTLSSLNETRLEAALQRELVTLTGSRIERQEFLLTRAPGTTPLETLAYLGTALLLGVPPEAFG